MSATLNTFLFIPLFILFIFIFIFIPNLSPIQAINMQNRLGIGASSQLGTGTPVISLKIQKSDAFSLGILGGFNTGKEDKSFATGIKFYRNLYDEPLLTFYSALMFALVNQSVKGKNHSGFQLDLTIGPEFHLSGLQSIGFSFETGLSLSNSAQNGMSARTVGNHLIQAAVHFYL